MQSLPSIWQACVGPLCFAITSDLIGWVQMGVQRIYLDAASKPAKCAWMAPSLGFSEISQEDYEMLAVQHTLVLNANVAARCLKVVPARAALLKQVSCAFIYFVCSSTVTAAVTVLHQPINVTAHCCNFLSFASHNHTFTTSVSHTEPFRKHCKAVSGLVTMHV